MSNKWECPICHSKAYQKHGGTYEPAYKISKEGENEVRDKIMFKTGTMFKCKGCSVFFENPSKFNQYNNRLW